MGKFFLFFIFLLSLTAFHSKAKTVSFPPHNFTLPDGYSLKQIAAPPLVQRPIHMSFDKDGNLYVTDSSGNTESAPEQLKNPTHRVLRLVDKDGDSWKIRAQHWSPVSGGQGTSGVSTKK